MRRALLIAAAASALVAGCRGQTSEDPPLLLLRNMWKQERYDVQSFSSYFSDHRSMRVPPAGSVPREGFVDDPEIATGRLEDGSGYVLTVPMPVIAQFAQYPQSNPQSPSPGGILARGQERYGIYCTPCHGATGDGQGIVVRRAGVTNYIFAGPPTFHHNAENRQDPDRLRHAPDGQIFATITNGTGNMPPYAAQIPVADRWAIVAYVRALQLSEAGAATEPRQ